MNNCAAGKVDCFNGGIRIPDAVHESGDSPDHMCHREINQEHPAPDEYQQRRVFYALGDGAHDQSRSDYRKHQLEHRVDVLRYPERVIGVGHGSDAIKEEVFGPAVEWIVEVFAEDEAVSKSPPENGYQPGNAEALGENGQNVL